MENSQEYSINALFVWHHILAAFSDTSKMDEWRTLVEQPKDVDWQGSDDDESMDEDGEDDGEDEEDDEEGNSDEDDEEDNSSESDMEDEDL